MKHQENIKHIVILASPNSTLLTIAGPLEIFTRAIIMNKEDVTSFSYRTHVVSIDGKKEIETSSGISIIAEGGYQNIDFPIDTLIVSGLPNLTDYSVPPKVLQWVKEQSLVVRRICSICWGAFILAEAGILDGKRATTHWQRCDRLAKNYPSINVEVAPYYVKDGNIYTSAGISSGMDLALALIEEDMGKVFALQIARQMVLFLKRPGNQIQYSNLFDYQEIRHLSIRKACEWILHNLTADLSVENLAEQVAMSPRNFARVFARELKITPAKYIDRIRVEIACQHLIETNFSLDEISEHCGVRSTDNLRRLFIKVLDTTPSQYRKSFSSAI